MDGHRVQEVASWPTAEEARAHAGKGVICTTGLPYKLWFLGRDSIALVGEHPTLEKAIVARESANLVLRVSGPHD